MASISNDPNGRRRVLFVAPDGSRKTVRLGKCDRKMAESICRHVVAAAGGQDRRPVDPKRNGRMVDRDRGDSLKDKLAAAGLTDAPARRSLANSWTSTS